MKEITSKLYRHNFVRYLLVGGTTFIIDFSLLAMFHGSFHIRISIATSMAYWVAVLYNFSLNRWWTFSARDKTNLNRHLVSYLILLSFNYLFTVIFVSLASHSINYLVAKVISVLISTSWTYFVYKNIIFKVDETSGKTKDLT
jgi:putative flippase GtrA